MRLACGDKHLILCNSLAVLSKARLCGRLVKVSSWDDNEGVFSNRMRDTPVELMNVR